MSNEQQSGKMWSGRFREPLDKEFEQWQRSIVFDWRLLEQEIAASKAHASALDGRWSITTVELGRLRTALDHIAAEFGTDEGKALVRNHAVAEDIHHFVELSLVERVGSLGLKAAYGTLAQRTDRNRPAAICARADRTRGGGAGQVGRGTAGKGAQGRRCGDAKLHAFAAGRAGAGGALDAGLRGDDSARCEAVAGLFCAVELLSAGIGRGGRGDAEAGSDDCGARSWDSLRRQRIRWMQPAIGISFLSICRR